MIPSFPLRKTINPMKICNISFTGIVHYPGSVSTLQNLTMISEDQTSISMSLNINLVKTPSKYLGLDFKLKGKRVVDFHFLVAKLTSKL